jgi:membrane-bound metal-dependent hydrolase YbcI (DUF457 family)
MTYRGHAVGALAAAAAVHPVAPSTGFPLLAMALAALIGGWAPDLDAPGAYMSRKVWPLPALIRLALDNPLTWALAAWRQGLPADRPEPARRSAPGAWFYSRLLVRMWMGRERAQEAYRACNGHRRPVPLSLRLYWNPLTRGLLGREGALGLYHFMRVGRSRIRTLVAHRGISHTWVACLSSALLFALGALALSPTLLTLWARWDQAVGGARGASQVGGALGALQAPVALAALLCLAYVAGYLSHILLDSGSVMGTRPHWPFSEKSFWILPAKLRYRTAR